MKKPATTGWMMAAALAGAAGGFLLGVESVERRRGGAADVAERPAGRGPDAAEESPAAELAAEARGEASGAAGATWPGAGDADRGAATRRSVTGILEIPGQLNRVRALVDFMETLDEDGFRDALEALRKAPRGLDSVVAGMMLYGAFARRNSDAAIAFAEELPPNERAMARTFIMGEWAGTDPEGAAAFLMQGADAEGRLDGYARRMAGRLANEWARRDPRKALEWVLGLDDRSRQEAMSSVISQWAGSDPREAAAYARQMAEGEDRKKAFELLAGEWARSDSRAALDWAQKLPEDERSGAVAQAVIGWAQEDAAAAAAYVSDLEDAAAREAAMEGVAARWAWKAPRDAVDWLAGQPESEGRQQATRAVMGAWARKDSHAASSWLAEQAPGPTTDRAIEAFTDRIMYDDPGSAAVWASTMDDDGARHRQMVKVARRWLQHGSEAAVEWIEASDLPADQKEELLSR